MNTCEQNKQLARRWFEQAWSQGRTDIADEVFAPGFVLNGRTVGPDGPRRSVQARHRAFAELSVEIVLQVAEGEFVTTHFRASGLHVAEYSGVPATGLPIVAAGVVTWQVRDAQVIQDWNSFDRWGLVAQLDPELQRRSLFDKPATVAAG